MSHTYKNLPRIVCLLGWLLGWLLGVMLGPAACGSSSSNGDLGVATFTMDNCGGAYNNIITGCDIKKTLATGGKVDLRAVRMSSASPLQLRSDFPTVLTVTSLGNTVYTLAGLRPGMATIIAFDGGGDVDHVTMQVDDANQIAFLEVSAEGGTFTNSPGGAVDGTFTLNSTVGMFTLLFSNIDMAGNKMIGRETFTAMLGAGLNYQSGQDNPTSLDFALLRPSQSGNYSLVIADKIGLAGYKMQITVP
jgi:hypothetical protein